jgi:hypothetical protein
MIKVKTFLTEILSVIMDVDNRDINGGNYDQVQKFYKTRLQSLTKML